MATIVSTTSFTARRQLRAEILRVLGRLAALVEAQRARGRSAAGDPLAGLVIEDGEAEGLIEQLSAEFGEGEPRSGRPDAARFELAERARAASSAANPLPLLRAADAFALDDVEYDALVLCVGVELDARIGRLVAYLNDHAGRPRPTLGLVHALAGDALPPPWPLALLERPAVRDGLLVVEGSGPLPAHEIRVDAGIAARVAGEDEPLVHGIHRHPVSAGLLDRLVLPDAVRDTLRHWGEDVRGGRQARTLALVGRSGAGRISAARAATSLAGVPLTLLEIDRRGAEREALAEGLRRVRCEARWTGSAIALRVAEDLAAPLDWGLVWESLHGVTCPTLLALAPEELAAASAAAPAEPLVLPIPEPDVGARLALWRALLPQGARIDERDLDSLAARFQFGPGRIARVIQRAGASLAARAPGTRRLDAAAVEGAARAIGAATMGALADRLPLIYTREQLVVPERVAEELTLAVAWVRHARHVLDEWGFGRRLGAGRGLTALFSGLPGTGKTMAAQVLARELGLELFRVDLSRTVSKYIGETEKNLGRIFDEARASGAAILFDEADALFGRRSEVKDAHDRYANVEIGYLLQRLEAHDGVTILATNRSRDLDEAFVRRFHVMVDFPLPNAADRARIWEGMLPADAARDADVDLPQLAELVELSGGEIKNAALAAGYLAAAEGSPIAMRHLRRAVMRELTKNGRVMGDQLQQALQR